MSNYLRFSICLNIFPSYFAIINLQMTQKQTSVVVVFSAVVLAGIIIGVLVKKGAVPVSPGEQIGGVKIATSTKKAMNGRASRARFPKMSSRPSPLWISR